MSSIYGRLLRISLFGQSHGPAIGVTIDGLPAGEAIDLDALAKFLSRRAPGRSLTTARQEPDRPELLSGLYRGHTCGAPLTAVIRNRDAQSGEGAPWADTPRPGHSDLTARLKYGGWADPRGGGHFSGRLTAPLCIAGGICLQLLARQRVRIQAHLLQLGSCRDRAFNPVHPEDVPASLFPTLLPESAAQMQKTLAGAAAMGDSLGAVIECAAVGVPAGLGDPMFDGMENRIAQAVFAIPGIKGLDFGSGFDAAGTCGSENNDPLFWQDDTVRSRSNHAGGILGGITTGMPLIFRTALKPTPSIALPQETVSFSGHTARTISAAGRNDPCIGIRAVPCVEAAAAIAIYDSLLEQYARQPKENAL